MNRLSKILSVAVLVGLFGACAGNKPEEKEPVDPQPAPTVEESAAVETKGPSAEELQARELEAQRQKLEEMINKIMSSDVYFEYDKAILTEKARELLSQVGDMLINESRFEVVVEGHTDARGTEAYNMSLGGRRAKAVQDYLFNYGVKNTAIRTVSYGEEKPKVMGESEEAYSQNRRANFKVNIVK